MNRPGDEFFPGAGLACDEHRAASRRHLLDQVEHGKYGWRVADHLSKMSLFFRLFTQKAVLYAEARKIERPADHHLKGVDIARLLQVVDSPKLHRFHRCRYGAISG